MDGILAPARVFKNLYSFCKMIGEDPNTLPPTPVPLLDAIPDNTMTEEIKDTGRVRDHETDCTESQDEAPASATQLYHAALVSSSTLDNVLAAFEADEGDSGIIIDRFLIRRNAKVFSSGDQLNATDRYKQRRYRSHSIHSLTERVDALSKLDEDSPGSPAQPSPQTNPGRPGTPDQKANAGRTLLQPEGDKNDEQSESSPDSHVLRDNRLTVVRSPDRHVSLGTLNRCPTFIRRQAQSLLPIRPVSKDKTSLAMLKERGAMSTPQLSSPTPSKRARLQRRIRPQQDTQTF